MHPVEDNNSPLLAVEDDVFGFDNLHCQPSEYPSDQKNDSCKTDNQKGPKLKA